MFIYPSLSSSSLITTKRKEREIRDDPRKIVALKSGTILLIPKQIKNKITHNTWHKPNIDAASWGGEVKRTKYLHVIIPLRT